MAVQRLFLWPIVLICYGTLLGALFHWIAGGWSGIVTLGFIFAIPIGVPSLVGYAGYLWRKNLLVGFARWEAIVCLAYPLLLVLLGGAFITARKLHWL